MKPLYTPSEFAITKSRELLPLQCYICNSIFNISKNEIQKSLKRKSENNSRRNELKYCSRECSIKSKFNGKYVACEQCGTNVYRTPTTFKRKHKHIFCSSSCNATWNNTHKTMGCRRSKIEMWIEKQLSILYPTLEIHYNTIDAINAELDIYIPKLSFAIELNGIFHYEPIYGKDKLNKMKSNDSRKFQACIENNIELCIIDITSQKKFTESSSKKFLDIIKNILNKKMGCPTNFEIAPQSSQD
jgi:hypothetical protein